MNKTMSPLFTDKLDKERLEVFNKLSAFKSDFVLAGGTAIMLHIGHRESYDFDCFAHEPLSSNLARKMRTIFPSIQLTTETDEVLTFKTQSQVEITFVYYPYPDLKPVVETQSLSIFHLDDLAANKAYTIGRRGQWRDYVDIFFLLKWEYYSLKSLIELAEKKYAGEFNQKLFLGQLVYFDDIYPVPTVFLKEKYADDEMKVFLQTEVEKYSKNLLLE